MANLFLLLWLIGIAAWIGLLYLVAVFVNYGAALALGIIGMLVIGAYWDPD